MKKRVRLLTGFRLSEISAVDKAACDLADITSVQIVKRSEAVNDLNDEALKAAGIKPEEAGVLRKVLKFFFNPPMTEEVKRQRELDAIAADVRKRLESEPIEDVAKAMSTPGYVMNVATDASHSNLAPSNGPPSHATPPGGPRSVADIGGNAVPDGSAMGNKAVQQAMIPIDPTKTKRAADAFTGGVNGNQISAPNTPDRKHPEKLAKQDVEKEDDGLDKKDFSDDKRQELAGQGKALPDGSYPIESVQDLKNAIQAFGRAKNKAKVKAHIKARAKALGATDQLPDDWKMAKSLYDVTDFAQVVMAIDSICRMKEMGSAFGQSDDDDDAIYAKLSDLRDQAGQLLIEMVQDEVDDLGGEKMNVAGADVNELAKMVLDALHNAAEQKGVAKAGAKYSAATKAALQACKGSMGKASGFFTKAQSKIPDDEDMDNGMAHLSAASGHLGKIDFEGYEPSGSGLQDKNPGSDADAPHKVAEADMMKAVGEQVKAAVEAAVAPLRADLEKSKESAHSLEVENAGLKARLEALGGQPQTPRVRIGNYVAPVKKGAADERIASQAAAANGEPDLTIKDGDDRRLIKTDLSVGFNKAFMLARRDPVVVVGTPAVRSN